MTIIKRFYFTPFLIVFYFFLYKLYIPRISAFGCFDDCFNFLGGYFLLHGKSLYSQIFFNHAPFMAFISAFIQYFFHPINLYDLILRHRQFILAFGFFMNFILFLRFGLPFIGFTLFYEITKFYIFGDRFLGEGVVVYPIIYLAGVILEKYNNKNLIAIDYLLITIFSWFIIFTRETFVPLVAGFWVILLLDNYKNKYIRFSLFSFLFP